MKKFFLRSIIILIVIFSSLISYLSIIGIETNKLNSQISHLVKNINKDLNIELRKIKLVLDPFNFVLNAKTVGPKLKIKEKELDYLTEKSKVPEPLLSANPDPSYGEKNQPLWRAKSNLIRITIFNGGHQMIPSAIFHWLSMQKKS